MSTSFCLSANFFSTAVKSACFSKSELSMSVTEDAIAGGVASAKTAGVIKQGASANNRVGRPWRMMGYFNRNLG
ncbi:conserved hypothetical protein [Vibrio coralliirubri]|nr:conserved hypothetical protein [Vibrio coralliirubri]